MVDFKKRALILMLAGTVSVTGSFAAENYKNCLMNMEFQQTGGHEISVILNTRNLYEERIPLVKKDQSTFVIMLPEMDSQAPTPDLSNVAGNISSVEIKKMPYSNGAKGYTKILIKTNGVINLNASSVQYIPSETPPSDTSNRLITTNQEPYEFQREIEQPENNTQTVLDDKNTKDTVKKMYRNGKRYNKSDLSEAEISDEDNDPELTEEPSEENLDTEPEITDNQPTNDISNFPSDDNSQQKYLLGLMVVFIIMTSIYFYIKAQHKLTNVLGEKLDIDVNNTPEDKQTDSTKNKRKISSIINKLDDAYAKTNSIPMKAFMPATENKTEQVEDTNIVDLDALFKEKLSAQNNDSEDNDAFDDFLSGFSFNDEDLISKVENPETTESAGYDEDFYENLINNPDLRFTKDDIACFNELLRSEVSDNVIKNIKDYAVSSPQKREESCSEKLLEKFVTTYSITQDISFTTSDIDVLKKLISVEIDNDFVCDLRTDSRRTAEMEQEILATEKRLKKKSEMITLHVKDMLPDLSAALKEQGSKPIKSEFKPETVYYCEGYEVNKLSVDFDTPDFEKELKKYDAFHSQPSEKYNTVDNSYSNSVNKINIKGLPDLHDALTHPAKYDISEKENAKANENSLFENFANIQLKPIDDKESEPADKDEFIGMVNDKNLKTDKTSHTVKKDKKITTCAENKPQTHNNIKNDNNNAIAKNKTVNKDKVPVSNKKQDFVPIKLNRTKNTATESKKKDKSKDLANILEKIRNERKQKKLTANNANSNRKTEPAKKNVELTPPILVKCILEGVSYDILSSVAINEKVGCHLAKSSEKYAVLAYKENELAILKEYDTLKSNKINARLSETQPDGIPRYIIRIGTNKFIVDIKDEQVRYVMDL